MINNWALFRLPNEKNIHFIGSENLKEIKGLTLSTLENVFVLRPFSIFEKISIIEGESIKINPDDNFLNKLPFHFKETNFKPTSKSEYLSYVHKTIKGIKDVEFQKIVPAKIKSIDSQFNQQKTIQAFKDACSNYPNAFINLTSTKKWGTWIGATPEKIISIDKKNNLETIALAGTQLSNGKSTSEAVWTQKEIEEQALVSRFIINCFKKIRLREFDENGPKTVKSGNLLHLKTTFNINLNEVDIENLGSTLLDLLHPTSAVSGMPKKEAMDFILNNENFDRMLYSGFIGPINYQNETNLYVNLRSALINKNSMLCFAGAGVTEDSNPEKEWVETENKCQIIENLFN